MNRNEWICQLETWQVEWKALLHSVHETGDRKAHAVLKAAQPDFKSLIHALNQYVSPEHGESTGFSHRPQEDLWEGGFSQDKSMTHLVAQIREKVGKLLLPDKPSSQRKSHAALARGRN